MAIDQRRAAHRSAHPDLHLGPIGRNASRGGADVQIYSATCRGLKQLSLALGRKTPKIGSCGVGQFEERLQSLGRDRYGAVRRDGYANVHEEGFSSYEHMDQLKIATQPPGCPVRNSSYGLVVTMPRGWRRQQFDLRFNLALRPFRLTAFADSLEGRGICTARGVPVERLIRFSNCSRNGLAGADEILVMEPFQDAARLATVMALVVTSACGAGPRSGGAAPAGAAGR